MAVDSNDFPARLLHAFVGRERELAELRAGFAAADAGRGCLYLIAGEPGIGKTRLAEEAVAASVTNGAIAVWGRCWEGGGAPAYWPWLQIFRCLAAVLSPAALRDAVGDSAAIVAPLAPDLVARAGCDVIPAKAHALESEQERFPLFDAASGLLRRLAEQQPLVLLLDDLHAADDPSLLLLEFLSRELRSTRLSVIGTYRDLEVQRDAIRSRLLHAAARNGHRLPLGGLSPDEVESLVRTALGADGAARATRLAARIFASTEGNPFFVDEVLRLVVDAAEDERGDLPLPQGVRDAVRERLRPLSPACRRLLTGAAVIGREFDLALLAAIDGETARRTALLDAVGEAAATGIVAALPEALGRYSFAHALFRETLYDEIAPGERARLHWAVAEALASRAATSGDEPLDELAHHALRGVAVGDTGRAVDYATRAGQRAMTQLAYEDAAAYFRQALDALTLAGDGDLARRAELLLACGEADAQAWNTTSAQENFDRAAAVARRLREHDRSAAAELLARAALGYGRTGIGVPRGSRTDPALVARLEEAVQALGQEQPALRARVLARQAVELYYSDAAERRAELAAEAARLAHHCGDVSTLAYVVSAQHFATWDSPDVVRRLALAEEAVRIAQLAGEQDTESVARLWRVLDIVEAGEFERWPRELDELEALARAMRQPRSICFALTARAMRALWYSRFDEVEALGQQAIAIGQRAQDTAAMINYGLQRFAVLRARGEHDVLLPEVDLWAQQLPDSPVVDCARTVLYADLGRTDEARSFLARLADDDFAALRRVNGLYNVICWVADACARLGDRDAGLLLERDLRPRLAANLAFAPRILFGPAAHWLGLLVALRDEHDEAVALFEDAAERSRGGGGAAAAAWSDLELARVLMARGEAGDEDRARALLRDAAAVADELGLGFLARRAQEEIAIASRSAAAALRAGAGGGAATAGRLLQFPSRGDRLRPVGERQADGAARYVLRREGDFWTASDGGAVLRLKDSKGLHYIAQLLREPDREFHVLDLVAADNGARAEVAAAALGSAADAQLQALGMHRTIDAEAGERVLDARARTAYQRRLEDLQDELEEATRFNDPGRAGRAREEIEFIARELARAVGIGQRDRSTASGAERARVNVTRAVKAVIRRIERGNGNLGRYLDTTIHTGTFCSYRPDSRIKVTWKL